ncbi:hypothetical protein [Ligilactobacillus animalis]|nr:hypothetical protein [Ligilactobacillus animalis]
MECIYCGEDLREAGACLVYEDEYYCDEDCLCNAILEYAEWVQLDELEG